MKQRQSTTFFVVQRADTLTNRNSNSKEPHLINCLDLTGWLDEEGYALQTKTKINMTLPLTSFKQTKSVNSTFTRSKAVSSPSISKNIFHLCSCWTIWKKSIREVYIVIWKSSTIYLFWWRGQCWSCTLPQLVDNCRFLQLFIVKIIFATFPRLSTSKGSNNLCLK